MAEDMIEPRFYVWVLVPSAVREGYLVGCKDQNSEWRVELPSANYIARNATSELWGLVSRIDPAPTFFSADAIDAPVSADLCERLTKRAQGDTKP